MVRSGEVQDNRRPEMGGLSLAGLLRGGGTASLSSGHRSVLSRLAGLLGEGWIPAGDVSEPGREGRTPQEGV